MSLAARNAPRRRRAASDVLDIVGNKLGDQKGGVKQKEAITSQKPHWGGCVMGARSEFGCDFV